MQSSNRYLSTTFCFRLYYHLNPICLHSGICLKHSRIYIEFISVLWSRSSALPQTRWSSGTNCTGGWYRMQIHEKQKYQHNLEFLLGLCAAIAVTVFAIGLTFINEWMLIQGKSFGWAFGLAVAGAFVLIVAGIVLLIEMSMEKRILRDLQNSQASAALAQEDTTQYKISFINGRWVNEPIIYPVTAHQ